MCLSVLNLGFDATYYDKHMAKEGPVYREVERRCVLFSRLGYVWAI